MDRFKWKFVENSKEVQGGFDVVLNPPMDSLRFFILGTPIEKIPSFIKSLLKSEGGGGDEVSYLEAYSNLDGGDLATGNCFNKDEVKVIHYVFGDIILKEKLFCSIFYYFGLKVLERNKENKKLDRKWREEMKERLQKLKEKFLDSNSL